MLISKTKLKKISKFLNESAKKEEIKKRYILNLCENFIANKNLTGELYIINYLVEKEQKGSDVSIYEYYESFYKFMLYSDETEKYDFSQKVLLNIFNTFFFGKILLIDSFVFLYILILAKEHINFSITYQDLVNFIKKRANLIESMPSDFIGEEAKIMFDSFINVLVNLHNNWEPNKKTISPLFLHSSGENEKNSSFYKNLIKKAVQPCEKEIAQILLHYGLYHVHFVVLVGRQSPDVERQFLYEIKYNDYIPDCYFLYIQYCKNGRFEEVENLLAGDLSKLQQYIEQGLRKKAPELEPYILQNHILCLSYAKFSLGNKRFLEGEPVIAQHAHTSFSYAKDVIRGRFELGEQTIARYPDVSFFYAKEVIGGRFKKGEKAILKNSKWKKRYKDFLKQIEKRNEKF